MRNHLSRIRQVIAWTVILVMAVVLAVAVLLPRLAGATPYTVLTSSMQPDLPPGTLVVVRPVEVDDVKVGSVMTYQLASGRPEVVTHRVVGQGVSSRGEVVLRTQGDANPSPDSGWVRPVQLKGELWYSVPYLGYVNNLLSGGQRQWVVYVAAALLLGYATAMFGSAHRSRGRTETEREGVQA